MAGGSLGGGRRGGITEINVTPFVDILLVILIIFMVTSTVVAVRQIPLDLPEGSTGEMPAEQASLGVTVDARGTVYLDGRESTLDAIASRIEEERDAGREVICLIAADGDTAHREVVAVIDRVRDAGVSSFAIEIEPVEVHDD